MSVMIKLTLIKLNNITIVLFNVTIFQRVPRYEMILKELVKRTNKVSVVYHTL